MTLRPRTSLGALGLAPVVGKRAWFEAEVALAMADGVRVAVASARGGVAILRDPPIVWYDETADFEPDAFREMAGRIRQ